MTTPKYAKDTTASRSGCSRTQAWWRRCCGASLPRGLLPEFDAATLRRFPEERVDARLA
ncbi:MAG: hypothetical protein OXF31_13365 [Gammaproteobacteria bacterium]|nr:hypothetical protein [Gammaproteobacteria bacterium]